MNLHDLSVRQLKRAAAIKQRIEALNKELRGILGAPGKAAATPRKKKRVSRATRAKLRARLKAYWAAKRAGKK